MSLYDTCIESIAALLEQKGYAYFIDPEQETVEITVVTNSIQVGEKMTSLSVLMELQHDTMLVCLARFPFSIPPSMLPTMAEMVVRANDGMYRGRFDYNIEHRLVSFLICEKAEVDDLANQVDEMLSITSTMMKVYSWAFARVMLEMETPEEAIAGVEWLVNHHPDDTEERVHREVFHSPKYPLSDSDGDDDTPSFSDSEYDEAEES